MTLQTSSDRATSDVSEEFELSTRLQWSRLALGVLTLIAVVAVVSHLSEGERLLSLLRAVQPLPLVIAVGLQAGTYVCVALSIQRVLICERKLLLLQQLFPLALAKQFVSQVVPSIGLSGNLMVIHSLRRLGVSRQAAVRAVLVSMFGYFVAFAAALGLTIVVFWFLHELHAAIVIPLTLLLLVLLSAAASVFWMHDWTQKILPPRVRKWLVQREWDELLHESNLPRLPLRVLAGVTLLQSAVFLLDGATLFVVLNAIGVAVQPAVAFAALVSAEAVASIGLVPAGLGTFEGTCVAVLHLHGIGIEAALAGTILLRGLTFWLPMLPGIWMARHELGHQDFVDTAQARDSSGSEPHLRS